MSIKNLRGVMIIPTGIGCEIGGHAGDANPAVKLIASVCDKLIVNPNAVNASDINEMPDNCLYVEGSTIDRFLEGDIWLKEVKSNKVLVVTNKPLKNEVVNSVNAARVTIGLDAEILVLKTPLKMIATKNLDGSAGGVVKGWEELCDQVSDYDFDAMAITTQINCEKQVAIDYFKNGGVNPWGKVESIASKLIATKLNKPVAHSPIESDWIKEENYDPGIVDPRQSAEVVSISYLHCILKGLWRAPRIVNRLMIGINKDDIDFMISPCQCWGAPHDACNKNGIPMIMVAENTTCFKTNIISGNIIEVDNYLEAVGLIQAMKEGISPPSVRRPLRKISIHEF